MDGLLVAIALLLPFLQLIQIKLIGTLLLQDLVAPLLLIMLLTRDGARERLTEARTVLLLVLLWLAGAVITDIYRGTVEADLARGWARIGLFAIHIATLWLLSNGGRIIILAPYVFSSGLVAIATPIIYPTDLSSADAFKFGAGGGLLLLMSALGTIPTISTFARGLAPSILIGLVGIVALLNDSRSLFAICLLSAAFTAFAAITSRSQRIVRLVTPASFVFFTFVGIGLAQALVAFYGYFASRGYLGQGSQMKYFIQTSGDNSLFLSGRSESLASVQAIIDSPIIGHGSWAQDPYYVWLYFARLAEAGLPASLEYYINNYGYLIPTHSYLLGSWVESGVLGVFIWVFLFALVVRALYAILKRHHFAGPLVAFSGFSLLWDIPFSPFATGSRFLVAAQICIMLSTIRVLKRANYLPLSRSVVADQQSRIDLRQVND